MIIEPSDLLIPHTKERYSVGVPMLKVLICDDNNDFLDAMMVQIREILRSLGKQARIFQYLDADTQLPECDIAFLDLDFKDKDYNGIDIARAIRKHHKDTVIIFVTNFPQYAPAGYEVHAFRYLMKSDIKTKLRSYLTLALDHLNEVKPTLSYTFAGEEVSVPLDDILYIESQLHSVVVHTLSDPPKSGNHTFYAGISSLENQLCPHGFLRIHKSYLVNMKYIQKFQCKFILLTDSTQLRVSEKNYSEQKKAYLLWKGNR